MMAVMDPVVASTLLPKISMHFFNMHRWQRTLLTLSLLIFGAGATGQITGYFGHVNEQTAATDVPRDTVKQAPEPTLRERLSPWATRFGASMLGGFLIGFALRVFIRITVSLIALGAMIMMALSYFNVMNVDLTAAETKYDSGIHWAEDQAYKLKDAAMSHLPSTGGSAFGAFAGFRRKRIVT